MRRLLRTLGFIAAAGIILYAARLLLQKRSQQQRAVQYQNALRSYSEKFRAGMTRKEIENYLHAQDTPFIQMCCVEHQAKWILTDLTKIGHEPAPWYCSEENVYIAFQFTGPERHSVSPTAEDSDTLTKITLFPWLGGCL